MKINKNQFLAAFLTGLTMVSVALGYWDKESGGARIDADLFAIDGIDQVERVLISHQGNVLDCRANSGGFLINEKIPMDESFLNLLAAILQQVKVQRPLTKAESQKIWSQLQGVGSHIQVFSGEQMLASYWAGGDGSKLNSYFATEAGEVYLVHLPGYSSYLSGLFELPAEQWHSRTIFLNTWRSLLSFSYKDHLEPINDFEIRYQDPFFSVSGITRLDSNRVINYIQNLVGLRASAVVDTVYVGNPWLELSTTDIDPAKNQSLTLFGDATQNSLLGKVGDRYFTFRSTGLEPIVKSIGFFEKED